MSGSHKVHSDWTFGVLVSDSTPMFGYVFIECPACLNHIGQATSVFQ